MDEYISREKAIETIQYRVCQGHGNKEHICKRGSCAYCGIMEIMNDIENIEAADVQPVDKDNGHIVYIGRKAYLAENTIMEFMKKMDIIRDSLAYIENYFDTYAETIRQINACMGRCTDITEVKYFIDRIKENSGYD